MASIGDRVVVGHRRRHGKLIAFCANKKYVKVRCDSDGILREYALRNIVPESDVLSAIDRLPIVSLEQGMKMRGQPTPNEN